MTNNGEKVRPILNSSSIIVDDAEPAARYGRAWLATLQKDAIKKNYRWTFLIRTRITDRTISLKKFLINR